MASFIPLASYRVPRLPPLHHTPHILQMIVEAEPIMEFAAPPVLEDVNTSVDNTDSDNSDSDSDSDEDGPPPLESDFSESEDDLPFCLCRTGPIRERSSISSTFPQLKLMVRTRIDEEMDLVLADVARVSRTQAHCVALGKEMFVLFFDITIATADAHNQDQRGVHPGILRASRSACLRFNHKLRHRMPVPAQVSCAQSH